MVSLLRTISNEFLKATVVANRNHGRGRDDRYEIADINFHVQNLSPSEDHMMAGVVSTSV